MKFAVSKRNTVNRLLAKALNNNAVSVQNFHIILSKFDCNYFLKNQVLSKLTRKPLSVDDLGHVVSLIALEEQVEVGLTLLTR